MEKEKVIDICVDGKIDKRKRKWKKGKGGRYNGVKVNSRKVK